MSNRKYFFGTQSRYESCGEWRWLKEHSSGLEDSEASAHPMLTFYPCSSYWKSKIFECFLLFIFRNNFCSSYGGAGETKKVRAGKRWAEVESIMILIKFIRSENIYKFSIHNFSENFHESFSFWMMKGGRGWMETGWGWGEWFLTLIKIRSD